MRRIRKSGHAAPSDLALAIEISHGLRAKRVRVPLGRVRLIFSVMALALIFVGGLFLIVSADEPGGATTLDAATRETRVAYEHRIAELRLQVDQLSRRRAPEPRNLGTEIQNLRERQIRVASRADAVARLLTDLRENPVSARPLRAATAPTPLHLAQAPDAIRASRWTTGKPRPEGFELRLRDGTPIRSPVGSEPAIRTADGAVAVERIADELERLEERQARELDALARPARTEAALLRRAFDIAGLSVTTIPRGRPKPGVGGPYVAASAADRELAETEHAIYTLDALRGALRASPLRKPLPGPLRLTSSFGYRVDPFLGRPALHSGIDLRDEEGKPVLATGAGVVSTAEAGAGYGNMVEIDHGGGLSTRYGHLSIISVPAGARVKAGDMIGRLGSTGRSTGPHLHYEVRVKGVAVDPERFLRAAEALEGGQTETADAR